MIGFYNYTVILTYISLLTSSVGIVFASFGDTVAAVFCLMISGFCDMFDGKIARTRKTSTGDEKKFGIQIDSLCDIICFCTLPAVIGVSLVADGGSWADGWWLVVMLVLLILCGLIRLAYFNVTEEKRQRDTKENRHYYTGFPVTSTAVLIPFLFCFEPLFRPGNGNAPDGIYTLGFRIFFAAFIATMALFYIVPVKVAKPHKVGVVVLSFIGITELAVMLCNYVFCII